MQLYQQQQSMSLEQMRQKRQGQEQNMQELEQPLDQINHDPEMQLSLKQFMQEQNIQELDQKKQELDQINRPFRNLKQLIMIQKRAEQLRAEQQELADMMKFHEKGRFDMIKRNIKDKESLELDFAEDCPEESVTRQSPKSSDDDDAQSSKKLAKLANPAKLAKLAAPKHDHTSEMQESQGGV